MSSEALPRTRSQAVPAERQQASAIAQRRDWRRPLARLLLYLILLVGGLMMVFPFVWMIISSLKDAAHIYSLSLIPPNPSMANYREVLNETPFVRWFANSLLVAVVTTASVAFFDSLVGYVLAKFTFPGRQVIFLVILSTLMVPTEMLVIPWYVLAINLHWTNSYWGIMFPGVISAFGIFLMRQYMMSIPNDLLDAARIDGASEFRIFWEVVMPLCRPALAALGIFTFTYQWDDFFWPLIIITSEELRTLPLGLALFVVKNRTAWDLLMAGSVIATVPVLIVFLFFQRHFIRGIAVTGMK